MTISAVGSRYTYAGNGSSTSFSFPRLFFADSDLKVYVVSADGTVTLKTLATHYTVSGAGSLSGGAVNFIVAPAAGETVVIYRDTAATQGLDLDNVTALNLASIEAAFDRAVLLINELKERLDRTVAAPLTRLGAFDYTLPAPEAGQVLAINGSATGFLLVEQGSGGGGDVTWGLIGGTLADQADLQAELDGKQASDLLLDQIAALSAPAADRILFYDHSAGTLTWLTVGTNISISGTTLNASGGAGSTDWGLIGGSLADQVDLTAALDAIEADIVALDSALAGKSNTGHTHAISDVTGLQTALDGKVDDADLSSYATLAGPALTGTPTAPTAADGTDTTQLATTAFVQAVNRRVLENAQTGTTYTLALTDAGKMVTLNNASAIALTIPTNASVAFPLNTRIDLAQFGAGQVTVGGSGVTIRSTDGKLKLNGQYAGASLWKKATDEWLLVGNLAT